MNLFGTKKKPKAQAPDVAQTVAQLQKTQDSLEKREQYLQNEISAAKAEGRKKMKNKDTKGATFYLQRIKLYQKQIDQIYGKRQNIDSLVIALQGTAMDRDVIQAMMMGHAATKAVINENQIDAVNDLMDDIREQQQVMDEAAEALSTPIMQQDEIDEDELLAAFEEEALDEEEELAAIPEYKIPTTTPAAKATQTAQPPERPAKPTKSKEESELDDLDALMA